LEDTSVQAELKGRYGLSEAKKQKVIEERRRYWEIEIWEELKKKTLK
jgi:hypothetical protein